MREREERIVGYTIFMGNSNRLDDRVKTDERNGYQMREKEERTIDYGVFLGSLIFDFGVFNRFNFSTC